jgi:hypothetical protein
MKTKLPKSNFFTVVMLLFACGMFAATITSTSTGGDFLATTTWVGGVVPKATDDVVIASGTIVTINSNVQINTIIVKNGGSLIVNSPYTLTVGVNPVPNPSPQVVDFQNGSIVTITAGASLVVYGSLNNSNNSSGVTFDGVVSVTGNFTGGNGSTIVGSGSLSTTGTITGAGFVFGSTEDCLAGPCNGGNLCSFKNTITGNQTICSNIKPTDLVGSTNATGTSSYQWQSSGTSGGGFTDISGAIDQRYVFSGILPQTTYFRLKLTNGGCSSVSSQVTITVNPIHTITSASNQTVCQNTSMTNIVMTLGGGATGATVTGLPAGVISSVSGKVLTISGIPTVSGIFNYAVTTTGSTCTVATTSATLNANPVPSVPTLGTITHPSCRNSKGSLLLSGLPLSGTIVQTGQSNKDYLITGSSGMQTIPDLVSGTYNFAISNGGCTSTFLSNVLINPSPATKTWNGTSWGPAGIPTIDNKVVFNGNYTSSADLEACSCDVGNAVVVFNIGHTLTVVNEVSVATTGSLIFENTASLVQTNNVINSGVITYKRFVTGIKAQDYVYWSSPVSNQTLGSFSPATSSSYFYSFDANGNNWKRESISSPMQLGVGYIIRGPEPAPASFSFTNSFIGVPNNGDIPITMGNAGTYNLIGNPYPSALDADLFLLDNNNKDLVGGTIYFWTHNTGIQLATNITNGSQGSGAFAYTSDDYASYNITGGVSAISLKAASDKSGNNLYKPTGKIAAGQSFFASSRATGQAFFKNSMRVGGGITQANSQFFKVKSNLKIVSSIEKNRVWLNLTNTQGAFKQTLIGYISGATNDNESNYDGASFNGNQFINFYSINQNKKLTIQGRALPFDESDLVPLGYKTTIAGDFKIAIDQTDGFLVAMKIYLEDKLLGKTQDLSEADYNFSTEIGSFDDRFVLTYASKTLGTEDFKDLGNAVVVSNTNKEIKISAPINEISKVFIYDISGRQIYMKSKVNKDELIISSLLSSEQLLIVKVLLQNNSTVTKKIIY